MILFVAVLFTDFLLVADGTGIYQISLDGFTSNYINFPTNVSAVAMDYDPNDRMIYWMDTISRSINRMPIDGGAIDTVVQLTFGKLTQVYYIVYI